MTSAKVNQLQLLQHNLQNVLMQKQQLEAQISEYDSALQEIKTSSQAYKIVGKIMIASSPGELTKDLNDKKELVAVHLNHLQKQEQQLQKKFEELQKEVVSDLKKDKRV